MAEGRQQPENPTAELAFVIYMLDTDLLIFLIRGLKSARRRQRRQEPAIVLDRCRKVQANGDSVGLSAVTVSELEFGVPQRRL